MHHHLNSLKNVMIFSGAVGWWWKEGRSLENGFAIYIYLGDNRKIRPCQVHRGRDEFVCVHVYICVR